MPPFVEKRVPLNKTNYDKSSNLRLRIYRFLTMGQSYEINFQL